MPLPLRKLSAVELARRALAEAEELVAKLEAERTAVLLGDDDGHLARIDARLQNARLQHRTATDRLAAREAEEARQASAKAEQQKVLRIGRIENKLKERDRIGAELAERIKAADASFCKLVEINRQIHAAWEWSASDTFATMVHEGSIVAAVRNEIFRIGGRVPLTGGVLDTRPLSYPGGEPERVELLYQPERTRALVDKLADATATAGRIMRTGRNDPEPYQGVVGFHEKSDGQPAPPVVGANGHAGPPKEQAQPSGPHPELGRLLARQNELAEMVEMDEAAEAEYAAIGKQIAAMM
jgi:hypothetical protein